MPRHLFDSSEILGAIPVPGSELLCRPVHSGERARGCVLLKRPSPFGYTCDAPVTWRKHRICLVSNFRWICRRLHWQVEKKMAGSPRIPYRCTSFSFIGATGPEVFNRICEDIVVGGNSLNTGLSTVLGSLDAVGTQATELLAAVHPVLLDFSSEFPLGPVLRKKQRLRSHLKSAQSARCWLCPSAWSSGIGAPIIHCRLCGLDNRDPPIDTPVS